MFSEMLHSLRREEPVNLQLLAKRFDLAMTKKMAVVKLPPAFWSGDPKINPPGGQLLLAALLLGDAERCALAAGVVAAERPRETESLGVVAVVQSALLELLVTLPLEKQRLLRRRAVALLGMAELATE